jgi:hypothetical protein
LWSELSASHDLGTESDVDPFGERIVDTHGSSDLALVRRPVAGREIPLVQSMARMTKGSVKRQAFAGSETVKRDREIVNTNLRHRDLSDNNERTPIL